MVTECNDEWGEGQPSAEAQEPGLTTHLQTRSLGQVLIAPQTLVNMNLDGIGVRRYDSGWRHAIGVTRRSALLFHIV
jgi:hypothetical protein